MGVGVFAVGGRGGEEEGCVDVVVGGGDDGKIMVCLLRSWISSVFLLSFVSSFLPSFLFLFFPSMPFLHLLSKMAHADSYIYSQNTNEQAMRSFEYNGDVVIVVLVAAVLIVSDKSVRQPKNGSTGPLFVRFFREAVGK